MVPPQIASWIRPWLEYDHGEGKVVQENKVKMLKYMLYYVKVKMSFHVSNQKTVHKIDATGDQQQMVTEIVLNSYELQTYLV